MPSSTQILFSKQIIFEAIHQTVNTAQNDFMKLCNKGSFILMAQAKCL